MAAVAANGTVAANGCVHAATVLEEAPGRANGCVHVATVASTVTARQGEPQPDAIDSRPVRKWPASPGLPIADRILDVPPVLLLEIEKMTAFPQRQSAFSPHWLLAVSEDVSS